MDRSVKNPPAQTFSQNAAQSGPKSAPDLKEMARSLLSPSSLFESAPPSRDSALQALDRLGSLETFARQSIPNTASKTTQASAAARAALARSAGAQNKEIPAMPVRYGSEKPEYQSALKDQSIIEALLDFHRKSNAPGDRARPSNQFTAPKVKRVEANPKPANRLSRTPGIAYPILRPPKGE